VAVVNVLLETEPETRHLIITCNSEGKLAREFASSSRVSVVALGDEVNDRSLVMTSSFTNLVLGAMFLGWLDRTDDFLRLPAFEQLPRGARISCHRPEYAPGCRPKPLGQRFRPRFRTSRPAWLKCRQP